MFRKTPLWLFIFLLLWVYFWLPGKPAYAQGDGIIPPAGFELLRSAQGVAIYQKQYSNGSPDYVQVADLAFGAEVFVLHGSISNPASGQGVYGGDNARFNRLSIKQFWNQLSNKTDTPFCVTNGQFFRLADSPTPLPFPLKKDGEILTDGYGVKEFPDQKLILEIWPDHLDIRELTQENLYTSSAPDIVAGLTEDAEKASKKAVGRTFIGIADRDRDNQFETLLIFNTRTARPQAAAEVLRAFGAGKVMMLDGGGSTQLVCQDQTFIDTERLIPQAIGIAVKNLPQIAAILIPPAEIQVATQGKDSIINLEISNRGLQTWRPGEIQILVEIPDIIKATVQLPVEVPTGSQTAIPWTLPGINQPGFYTAKVSLDYKGELFPLQAGKIDFALLSPDLTAYASDLQNSVAEWSGQTDEDLSANVQAWIAQYQAEKQGGVGGAELPQVASARQPLALTEPANISINNIIWIPLLMIPMAALMMAAIRRVQFTQD